MAAQGQPPAALVDFVQQLDAAASQENLSQVMRAYSSDLVHGDGLSDDDVEAALEQFWEQYSDLNYKTDITSWEETSGGYTTETETTITGSRELGDQLLQLTAVLTAQQEIVGEQIVSQTILSENNIITTGSNPPTLDINLPEQIDIGQQFYFDAIVMEPLDEHLVLGAATETIVNPSGYIAPSPVEFDLLSSGGLFKMGRAPTTPGQQWLSAVIIRDDGITGVTRRLQITPVE